MFYSTIFILKFLTYLLKLMDQDLQVAPLTACANLTNYEWYFSDQESQPYIFINTNLLYNPD